MNNSSIGARIEDEDQIMNDCSLLIDLGSSKSDDDDKICTSNDNEAGFEGEDDDDEADDDVFLQLFDTEKFKPSEFLKQSYADLETASEVSFI